MAEHEVRRRAGFIENLFNQTVLQHARKNKDRSGAADEDMLRECLVPPGNKTEPQNCGYRGQYKICARPPLVETPQR